MRELNNAELINTNEARKFFCLAELINASEPFVCILWNELMQSMVFFLFFTYLRKEKNKSTDYGKVENQKSL